jgi:hypothetical protein
MSTKEEKELVLVAFELSNVDPRLWERFTTALASFADGSCVQAVRSDPSTALTAHGRAQGILAVSELVTEVRERAKKLSSQSTK